MQGWLNLFCCRSSDVPRGVCPRVLADALLPAEGGGVLGPAAGGAEPAGLHISEQTRASSGVEVQRGAARHVYHSGPCLSLLLSCPWHSARLCQHPPLPLPCPGFSLGMRPDDCVCVSLSVSLPGSGLSLCLSLYILLSACLSLYL